MTHTLLNCAAPPDRPELDALFTDYYALMISRMAMIGFHIPQETAQSSIEEYWAEIARYLPPLGQTWLARDTAGRLVGCGVLKRLDRDTGELKRLFVRDSARGTGLGRQLVQARIDRARHMGLRKLVVDTLSQNVEMMGLYRKLGFAEVPPNPSSTSAKTDPSLVPHMVFFEFDLSKG
jgi:GNAT superfamily N-acetyltransferase